MANRYTSEEKIHALKLLTEKGGDVPLVSYLLGISERTLYTWRKYQEYEADENQRQQQRTASHALSSGQQEKIAQLQQLLLQQQEK